MGNSLSAAPPPHSTRGSGSWGLAGRETDRWPVSIPFGTGTPVEGALVHRHIDYSIPRPGLDARAPGETLRAVIARGAATTIRVIGTETTVQATFTLTAHTAPWRARWFGFSGDGAGVLSHYYREGQRIVQFQPRVTLKDFADLRVRIIDATIRVTVASSVAGSNSALAVVLPRKCEPRNPEPE